MYNPRSVKKIGRREGRQGKMEGGEEVVGIEEREREKRRQIEMKEEETKLEFECIKVSKWQKSSLQ